MARVLILGGAGFIGYHLALHHSITCRDQVTLVDNLARGRLDQDLEHLLAPEGRAELVTADLTDPTSYDYLDGRFDLVYLLAGIVGVRNVESGPARVIHTNVSIILNTLEWLSRVGCGRLLFASTSEVYAGSVELGLAPVPTSEEVPLAIVDVQHPRATYGLSKMLGEAAVSHYSRSSGFEAVIVRYHNIYGPRMGYDHVIPELMQRISRALDPLPVYGLDQTRAFCYVADAVQASQQLMRCPLDDCQVVHVGNDQEEVTIRGLTDKLLDVTEFHPSIEPLPAPSGAVSRRCPDTSKLRALTGFHADVNLDQGLALTWEWYRQELERLGNQKPASPSSEALPPVDSLLARRST